MQKSPQVGVASVWWEGNPCNMHLLDLGKTVKKAVTDKGLIGWQYNTIGVSDAITMGSEGTIDRSKSVSGGVSLTRISFEECAFPCKLEN